MRYIFVDRRVERVGNSVALASVVHFTFHILRRTASGQRLGNVAEGPHSFRINVAVVDRSDARAPQRPQNTLYPRRNISPTPPL